MKPIFRTERGFTLIELMIVVAVIAILGAVAYPTYRESVAKSNRADMQRALADAEQYLRRYYSSQDTFASASLPTALAQTPKQGTAAYTIAVSGTSDTGFTLTATRAGSMTGDKCGDLSIDQTGAATQANNATDATQEDCFKGF